MKRAAKGGDILIKPLRNFVAPKEAGFFQTRRKDRFDKFAVAKVLLTVFQKERLKGKLAAITPAAQTQCRTKSDQRRRHVSDWRAVGDIPTNCSGVADLAGADTPNKFAKVRINIAKHINGVSVTGASANGDAIIARLYVFQIVD